MADVPTLIILLLISALSGVPAAAVACDLVLCAGQATEAQGCHRHDGSQRGDVVSAAADDCTHLAVSTPSAGPVSRHALDRAVPAVAAPWQPLFDDISAARRSTRAAPPPSVPTPLALRI